jgi:hypothetical protein
MKNKVKVLVLKDSIYFKEGLVKMMSISVANDLVKKEEAKILEDFQDIPKIDYQVIKITK